MRACLTGLTGLGDLTGKTVTDSLSRQLTRRVYKESDDWGLLGEDLLAVTNLWVKAHPEAEAIAKGAPAARDAKWRVTQTASKIVAEATAAHERAVKQVLESKKIPAKKPGRLELY